MAQPVLVLSNVALRAAGGGDARDLSLEVELFLAHAPVGDGGRPTLATAGHRFAALRRKALA